MWPIYLVRNSSEAIAIQGSVKYCPHEFEPSTCLGDATQLRQTRATRGSNWFALQQREYRSRGHTGSHGYPGPSAVGSHWAFGHPRLVPLHVSTLGSEVHTRAAL